LLREPATGKSAAGISITAKHRISWVRKPTPANIFTTIACAVKAQADGAKARSRLIKHLCVIQADVPKQAEVPRRAAPEPGIFCQ
jgi:hypothetical protein